jgi:hypothetical protein
MLWTLDKDKLYWEWKVVDGEMVAVVAKHDPTTAGLERYSYPNNTNFA